MSVGKAGVCVLGIYVADLAFRASRLPAVGETLMGSAFALGPGGKGSNQAVAAARVGGSVTLISKVGNDPFGDNAFAMWEREGIRACVSRSAVEPTGAAFIYVNEQSGENAIIVVPGASGTLSVTDVKNAAYAIENARVFMTQLEQPASAALRGLELARAAGVTTIFNPAPAVPFDDAIYSLSDFITPNESEASLITGISVEAVDDARRAGDVLLRKGVGAALITLGEKGALFHSRNESVLVPAFSVGSVVETAGAGDAFNGGFATALSQGRPPMEAARFGCAVAGISVTRAGTASSMPHLADVMDLLKAT
jgi:ribokinase